MNNTKPSRSDLVNLVLVGKSRKDQSYEGNRPRELRREVAHWIAQPSDKRQLRRGFWGQRSQAGWRVVDRHFWRWGQRGLSYWKERNQAIPEMSDCTPGSQWWILKRFWIFSERLPEGLLALLSKRRECLEFCNKVPQARHLSAAILSKHQLSRTGFALASLKSGSKGAQRYLSSLCKNVAQPCETNTFRPKHADIWDARREGCWIQAFQKNPQGIPALCCWE